MERTFPGTGSISGLSRILAFKEKMQNQSKWSWNFTNLCDKVAETSRKMKRVDSPTMGCTSSGTGAISGLSRLLALKWQTSKHQRHIIINKQGGCETTGDLGCLKLDPRCWPRCNFFDVPLQFLVKGFFLSCLCQWNVVVDIKLVYWTNSLHKCRVGQVGTNKCDPPLWLPRERPTPKTQPKSWKTCSSAAPSSTGPGKNVHADDF